MGVIEEEGVDEVGGVVPDCGIVTMSGSAWSLPVLSEPELSDHSSAPSPAAGSEEEEDDGAVLLFVVCAEEDEG